MIAWTTTGDFWNVSYNCCLQKTYLSYGTLLVLSFGLNKTWGVNGRALEGVFEALWKLATKRHFLHYFYQFLRCFEICNICHFANVMPGYLGLFRLIWGRKAHLNLFQLIEHSSFRLIWALLGSFKLILDILMWLALFEHTQVYLSSFKLI